MTTSPTRLDLYLASARAEAYALLDVGAPYGRIIARSDVAPSDSLAVCRHQVETARKVTSLRYHDDGYHPTKVARWVERACKDAANCIVEGCVWQTASGASLEYGVACIADDKERDVYRAWFIAHARYLDESSDTLAATASLCLTKASAVTTLQRYGSVAAACAAADYAMVNRGEWLPTPDEVAKMTVGSMSGMAKTYPKAYGSWGAGKEAEA